MDQPERRQLRSCRDDVSDDCHQPEHLAPFLAAGRFWLQINAWEALPHSIGFSHELPTYNTQQYYELIGKYSEFKYGWDTYVGKDGTRYGDDGDDVTYIPQQMKTYADNRGKANDYYYTASLMTGLAVVNHILSALDGAWSTSNYNKQITSEIGNASADLGGGEVTLATELTVKVHL